MTALSNETLRRWRANPVSFITEVLRNPDTGQPFELFAAERTFLQHSYQTGADGRLLYPEQIYSGPKKLGKTAFAAMHLLTTTMLFGGRYAESFCIANDLEQAQSRVFQACCRIVEASPLLKREAKITANKIIFTIGATISALASEYAGAAGAAPTESTFDELFAYTSRNARLLFDEMVPTPTKKISCRLTVTTAGFGGESQLLEELYRRGLQEQQVASDLYAGNGLLMYWTHTPQAPWQTEAWLTEMRRSLRPAQYLRMIENRFTSSESSFIDPATYDQCVDVAARPVLADPSLPVWVGVDASIRHDSTALVAVSFDRERQLVRLVAHKIFQPSPERPLDFEGCIEQTLFDWSGTYQIKAVRFDPYQLISSAQRLTKLGIKMEGFPQTTDRLTASSQNLYELITGRSIVFYLDAAIRLAMTRAVAIESSRGWRIAKEKAAHKIDVVVALAMAALAAVRNGNKRDIRQFAEHPAHGNVEIDVRSGRPLHQRRGEFIRYPDGTLHLHSDNSCWPGRGLH